MTVKTDGFTDGTYGLMCQIVKHLESLVNMGDMVSNIPRSLIPISRSLGQWLADVYYINGLIRPIKEVWFTAFIYFQDMMRTDGVLEVDLVERYNGSWQAYLSMSTPC